MIFFPIFILKHENGPWNQKGKNNLITFILLVRTFNFDLRSKTLPLLTKISAYSVTASTASVGTSDTNFTQAFIVSLKISSFSFHFPTLVALKNRHVSHQWDSILDHFLPKREGFVTFYGYRVRAIAMRLIALKKFHSSTLMLMFLDFWLIRSIFN